MTAPPPVAYVLDLPYLARRAWHAVERAGEIWEWVYGVENVL